MTAAMQPRETTPFCAPQADSCFSVWPSPLGDILLVSDGSALTGLYLAERAPNRDALHRLRDAVGPFRQVQEELGRYFAGDLKAFTVPLAPRGTPFQLSVWQALLTVPYGETRSYGQIARDIGHATAVRAVGAANGRNPISLIVPCHRVIGQDGSLTGYGWGLERKRWLLDHEAARRG
jgi:methylated-DNA-[protein]-cysteine S-methyltransferase